MPYEEDQVKSQGEENRSRLFFFRVPGGGGRCTAMAAVPQIQYGAPVKFRVTFPSSGSGMTGQPSPMQIKPCGTVAQGKTLPNLPALTSTPAKKIYENMVGFS